MFEKNNYIQQIVKYLSNISNQKSVLYLAIGGVTICLVLIVLGIIFPKGFTTDNQSVRENLNQLVATESGITSEYTAQQAIDFVKHEIQSVNLGKPICSTDQGEFTAFFSHRKYWNIAFLCPAVPSEGIHAGPEYLYEFNELDKTVTATNPLWDNQS